MNCFIIAEAGVNFRNFNEADELIRLCSAAGVNAVKFQAHSDDIIYSLPNDLSKHLKSIQLNEQNIRYLYWRCCQNKVEMMVTPFYPDCVSWINPYVKRWKIREKDNLNGTLIDTCLKTGKELLISTQYQIAWNYDPRRHYIVSPNTPRKKDTI
jgi:sialic acid synthase SpsE